MSCKDDALKALSDMGIDYEIAYHAPVHNIEDCKEAETLLGAVMPRNIFLCTTNKKNFALLICRPSAVFKTSSISRQAGMSRLSFAPEEALRQMLGAYPNAVSPLGLINDAERQIKLLIDQELLKEDSLLFHPLDNSCSVKIKTEAFTRIFLKNLGYDMLRVDMEQIGKD